MGRETQPKFVRCSIGWIDTESFDLPENVIYIHVTIFTKNGDTVGFTMRMRCWLFTASNFILLMGSIVYITDEFIRVYFWLMRGFM